MMNHTLVPTFLAAIALLPSAALRAQAHPGRDGETQFVLAAGEHDLRTVITAAASYLGRNLLLADTQLQGGPAELKVALQVGQKLDRDGCLAVVTQLAFTFGLVLVPIDRDRGIWEFLNANGPRRNEIFARAPLLSVEEARKLKGVCTVVFTVIPVQHVRATAVTQTLRPFFASGGNQSMSLGTAGSEDAVILSGFVDNVLSAAALIAAIDVPQKEREAMAADRLRTMEARVQALEARLAALEGKAPAKN